MKNIKYVVPKKVIIIILSICYFSSYGTSKVLIKANIVRGERFVTVKTNAKEIEDKVSEILTKKGFDIITTMETTEDILFVDFFIYQFPGQYPAVTITIRTQKGIHYLDQEYRKVFVDRELTNVHMAMELAERVPTELNKELVYRVSLGNLISSNKQSNTAFLTLNSKYYSTIKWKDNNNVPFIISNDLGLYLLFTANFTGLKKQLTLGPIVLKMRINNSARFELVNINSHLDLNDEQKIRIQEFIDSFPLWLTNTEVEDIEILYGLN